MSPHSTLLTAGIWCEQLMKSFREAFLKREWEVLKALSSSKFIRSSHDGLCSEIISSEVCLKNTGITSPDLIKLGAVYVQSSNDVKPRRILSDMHIVEGDLIRLHPFPRRYDKVHDIDWKKIIVHDEDDFIVINKPAGIPCNPTVDNYYENIFVGLQLGLNYAAKLYLPHRLDTDTTGIMLLGKTKKFTTYFGSLLVQRENITKRYRAIIAADSAKNMSNIFSQLQIINSIEKGIPKGLLLTNYQLKSSKSPKIFTVDQTDDSSQCQLVLSSKTKPVTRTVREWEEWTNTIEFEKYDRNTAVKFHNAMSCWLGLGNSRERPTLTDRIRMDSSLDVEDFEENSDSPGEDTERNVTLWEVDIELLTGRTHQCRGQMQGLGEGIHIAGDNMYPGATAAMRPDGYQSSTFLALQACYLSFPVYTARDKSLSCSETSTLPNHGIPVMARFELQTSWWQPLSDMFRECAD